jgi:DNA-binding response OmpR family regulator
MALALSRPTLNRILFVEPDPDLFKTGREALGTMTGVTVEACKSNDEALRAISRSAPDLILLDFGATGAESLAFLRRLRKMPIYARIPVVFTVDREDTDALSLANDPAAIATIRKPYEPVRLNTVLRALWAFHHT